MDDEVCMIHTYVARLRVMQTTSGRYRRIVHLPRIGEDPGTSDQHDTEGDFASDAEARDAARTHADKSRGTKRRKASIESASAARWLHNVDRQRDVHQPVAR